MSDDLEGQVLERDWQLAALVAAMYHGSYAPHLGDSA